ncbi:hypothetical protein ACE1AT_09215 [Pelatocladus sp. BLCC-F211]|uniref:hypothetical protein n=1 Tax=Pelatocladus sp. BLCC-F211 TaxID=3342752 RepID=UPI0035B8D12F
MALNSLNKTADMQCDRQSNKVVSVDGSNLKKLGSKIWGVNWLFLCAITTKKSNFIENLAV